MWFLLLKLTLTLLVNLTHIVDLIFFFYYSIEYSSMYKNLVNMGGGNGTLFINQFVLPGNIRAYFEIVRILF